MQYRIIGTTVPAVEVSLSKGEAMYTQSGAMAWQSKGIEMESNTRGGVLKGLGRMLSRESFFMATYTATSSDAMVAFASTVPGSVLPVDLSSTSGFTIQKGAFLCAQPTVELNVTFSKKFSSGLFGGEGFILQKMTGSGLAFLEVDGDVIEKQLNDGEVLKVDTGNVVGFEESVNYEIEMVKGLKNILFGGEGLFLTKLTGPGKVILQTLNFNDFANRIVSLFPNRN